MAANGISTLPTKQERQIAKLNLAAANRLADGNLRYIYVITQLPTVYAPGDNDTGDVIDNPNTGGLILGRPWIIDSDLVVDNIDLENGDDLLTEDGYFILLE